MAKVPGSIWVEGDEIHFVDQFSREWYYPPYGVKVVTGKAGSMWYDPTNWFLMFMNEAGGTAIAPWPYGDAVVSINAVSGSVWVGADNQLHWIAEPWPSDPTHYKVNVRGHNDTALVNTHTDTHTDTPHTDSAHSDTAHTDVPASSIHNDYHNDDPHHDFTDQFHGDHSDTSSNQNFNDFSDHIDYYHPKWGHGDGPGGGYAVHGDYSTPTFHEDYAHTDFGINTAPENSQHDDFWNHNDTPHGDTPHGDSHRDAPHQDEATEYWHDDHWDTAPHNDIPHVDVPHGDGHADTHSDSHGDTPHTDYPILIGP